MSVLKKPYEISIWKDDLMWYRLPLRAKFISSDQYKPGKYYSQKPTATGALSYTVDYDGYQDGQVYYEKAQSPQPLTGTSANDVDITGKTNWYGSSRKIATMVNSFEVNETYYVFSNDKKDYIKLSDSEKEKGPIKGKIYFIDSPSGTMIPNVVGQYYQEQKLYVIGSNTMTSPFRAVKPKLTSKITGENTLEFTVYSHYQDEGELRWNPFMGYLTNERKIKLKYDGKWYDFVIKNISEDSASKAFTYTCKDLFVNELSKTGFELEFDHELGNNMGNLEKLANEVLRGSDWSLRSNMETILQYIEEGVYYFTFNKGLSGLMTEMYGKNGYNGSVDISSAEGKVAYLFHSSVDEQTRTTTMQFLYDPTQAYRVDDKNVIIGYSNDAVWGVSNFTIKNVSWMLPPEGERVDDKDYRPYITINGTSLCLSSGKISFESSKRGERLVKSQKTDYDKRLGQAVKVYGANGDIYGFEDTEYISAATVMSYVTTPSDFTSTAGWRAGKATEGDTATAELECVAHPKLTAENYDNYTGGSYLKFSPTEKEQVLFNSGIWDNRGSIGSFVKDEAYTLTLACFERPPETASSLITGTPYPSDKISVNIQEYELKDGYFKLVDNPLFDIEEVGGTEPLKKYKCSCKTSLSEKELKEKRIGIFVKVSDITPMFVQKMEFYPLKLDAEGKECVPGGIIEPEVKTIYYYYDKNADFTSIEDLKPIYRGNTKGNYPPYYGLTTQPAEAFEKVRSITAKESNRFNLLQNLCELFQCWVQFEIEHENNGTIVIDDQYRQQKWVTYKKYIGRDNSVGFKYGINLKSIKRTLDSNGAISKIIVKSNSNELGKNGFCSIARAKENPSGENFIFNFDYYIGQNLLTFSTVNADLNGQYNLAQGYMGYNRQLKALNNVAQRDTETLSEIVANLTEYNSQYQAFKYSVDTAEEQILDKKIEFKDLTQVDFNEALTEYQSYDENKHKPDDAKGDDWWKERDNLWGFYRKEGTEYVLLERAPGSGDFARLKWWDDIRATSIRDAIARLLTTAKAHKIIYEKQLEEKRKEEARRDELVTKLNGLRDQKVALNQKFYQKYSRFIQEGSWISEDYYDDDLYYIDALSTLYTSSRPQVKYTVDVIDLSQLEGYEPYQFALGDKTYVEDREFFGYAYDGSGRLYREEVIVSEVCIEFDSPESNKITVQNYKTQFEDLFQRVVATTQQVQFSTGEYKRGAAILSEDGTIDVTTLQKSILKNSLILQNAKDQSVIIGDDGITTTNLSRPNEMLRIVSGGLFLSDDGGESWVTGISAGGINASCITTGQLNVSEVNLTMGDNTAFRWDKLGINAYKRTSGGISPGTFTRFDQFGLYGIVGSDTFDPLNYNTGANAYPTAIDYIQAVASFGLTWDRFWMRSSGTDGYVSISSENDFEVIRQPQSGTKVAVIKIGRLNDGEQDYYGIRIGNLDGEAVMETTSDGELWLRKKLSVNTTDNNSVQIGMLGEDTIYPGVGRVINANDKFMVYEDGHVEATDIKLTGDAEFEGKITATGGQIGGLTIEEWSEMGFQLKITSDQGWLLRDDMETTLTATMYRGSQPAANKGSNSAPEWHIAWEETVGGETITQDYIVTYEWFKNGTSISSSTSINSISVSLGDTETVCQYGCEATLTRVEAGGSK